MLSDGHAAEILESLKPELRSEDYDAAVEKAVNRIVEEALSKGYTSDLKGERNDKDVASPSPLPPY